MGKTIKISEQQLEQLEMMDVEQKAVDSILAESLCPDIDQVLIVKKFLDDNFMRGLEDDIDDYANPIKRPCLTRLVLGKPTDNLSGEKVVVMLLDKFPKMIEKKDDAKEFFKQIVKDWYDKKITKNGQLTVLSIGK